MESLALLVTIIFITVITLPIIALLSAIYQKPIFLIISSTIGIVASTNWTINAPMPTKLVGIAGLIIFAVSIILYIKKKRNGKTQA